MTPTGKRVARYRIRDTEVTLATGAELANWGEFRVGLRRGDGSTHVLVGDPDVADARLRHRRGVRRSSATTGSTAPTSRSRARRFARSWLGGPRVARRIAGRRHRAGFVATRAVTRSLQLRLVDGRRIGARRHRRVAAEPVHARRFPRALRTAVGCARRHAVRHRARDPVSAHQSRRHGILRISGVPGGVYRSR